MIDYVANLLRLYKYEREKPLTKINISPLPSDIKELEIPIKMKFCYNNIFYYVKNMIISGYDKNLIRYVVGYGQSVIPVEHCVLKYDGEYYDPTWELALYDRKHISNEFVPIIEITWSELLKAIHDHDKKPPDLLYFIRKQAINKKIL